MPYVLISDLKITDTCICKGTQGDIYNTRVEFIFNSKFVCVDKEGFTRNFEEVGDSGVTYKALRDIALTSDTEDTLYLQKGDYVVNNNTFYDFLTLEGRYICLDEVIFRKKFRKISL